MEMTKFNYMLEIYILRYSTPNNLRCPEGCFLRVWVPKRRPGALLAKTMFALLVAADLAWFSGCVRYNAPTTIMVYILSRFDVSLKL